MKERRGRSSKASTALKGRPPKLDKQVEEDLIAENQRLRMENEYLKITRLSSFQKEITERDKAQIVFELRREFKFGQLLKLSKVPRSTYYCYISTRNKPDKYKKLSK